MNIDGSPSLNMALYPSFDHGIEGYDNPVFVSGRDKLGTLRFDGFDFCGDKFGWDKLDRDKAHANTFHAHKPDT